MGERHHKIARIARYLTGAAGIPGIRMEAMAIHAPVPFRFTVTTDRKYEDWGDHIYHDSPDGRISVHIRYYNRMPDPASAWVGMRLDQFAVLLKAYQEKIEEEGRTNAPEHRW